MGPNVKMPTNFNTNQNEICKRNILLIICACGCLMYLLLYFKEIDIQNVHHMFDTKYESLLYSNSYQNSSNTSEFMSQQQNRKTFKILWYQEPFWINRTNVFPIHTCRYDNCKVLFDKSEISECDVVLFHHDKLRIQPKKFKHQIWVFVSFEPEPYSSKYGTSRRWENAFDWTMSFRKDSEGYGPYREVVSRQEKIIKNYSEIFRQKTKDVVWFVSNCDTLSRREDYVKQMKAYINIDLFGKCGNMSCRYQDCKSQVIKQYKFYIAFENAICNDYSSEKTFDVYYYGMNIIPVTRGNPNIKSILPNGTFISSLDFNSPKELALYLKTVGSNETLYTNFLSNIDKYTTTGLSQYLGGVCSLCKMLTIGYKRKRKLNIIEWLSNQCVNPTDF